MINFELVDSFAKIHPKKNALDDGHLSLTWEEFRNYILFAVSELKKINTLQSQKLSIFLSKNTTEVIVLGSAFASLGIAFQGLDYHLEADKIISIIERLNINNVFVSREFATQFSFLKNRCTIHVIEDIFGLVILKSNRYLNQIDKLNLLFKSYSFTSGTTGDPKIVYRTKSFDNKRFSYLKDRYNFNENDIHLVVLPLYHVSAVGWLRLFLSLGCSVTISNYTSGYQLCDVLVSKGISTTIMSPNMLKNMLDQIDDRGNAKYFEKLRFLITGGKNCSINLKMEAIRKLGKIVHEYYGTTETGINTLLDSDEAILYSGSVGKEFEGNKIVVVDNENRPLAKNEIGRIAINSYMNMDCYINSSMDEIYLDDERYIVTSDYGFKNEQGFLFVTQRANKRIKSIYNLYLLENKILNLPYVSDVYVRELIDSNGVLIDIVPKYYIPSVYIKKKIAEVARCLGVEKSEINPVSNLCYTLTGKIKSTLTQSL